MDALLIFLILLAPFVVAALLDRTSSRSDIMSNYFSGVAEDSDWHRIQHDADAVRTRFEQAPTWPRSGGCGERR